MLSSIQYVITARKPRIAAAYQRSSLDFTNSSHTGAQHAARNTATIGEYNSAISACEFGGTKNGWLAARSAAVASATLGVDNVITSLTLTNAGKGYLSDPTVTIAGGGLGVERLNSMVIWLCSSWDMTVCSVTTDSRGQVIGLPLCRTAPFTGRAGRRPSWWLNG